jgi:hypothetical protein
LDFYFWWWCWHGNQRRTKTSNSKVVPNKPHTDKVIGLLENGQNILSVAQV